MHLVGIISEIASVAALLRNDKRLYPVNVRETRQMVTLQIVAIQGINWRYLLISKLSPDEGPELLACLGLGNGIMVMGRTV